MRIVINWIGPDDELEEHELVPTLTFTLERSKRIDPPPPLMLRCTWDSGDREERCSVSRADDRG